MFYMVIFKENNVNWGKWEKGWVRKIIMNVDNLLNNFILEYICFYGDF